MPGREVFIIWHLYRLRGRKGELDSWSDVREHMHELRGRNVLELGLGFDGVRAVRSRNLQLHRAGHFSRHLPGVRSRDRKLSRLVLVFQVHELRTRLLLWRRLPVFEMRLRLDHNGSEGISLC